MGFQGTNWELGFRQCSFHHAMQVLRIGTFCAFSVSSAFPPCYVPLCLSTSGKAADLWNFPSTSSLLWRNTILTVAAHQRLARLICHLPPRSSTLHEAIDVTRAHPHVRHPPAALRGLDRPPRPCSPHGVTRLQRADHTPKACKNISFTLFRLSGNIRMDRAEHAYAWNDCSDKAMPRSMPPSSSRLFVPHIVAYIP